MKCFKWCSDVIGYLKDHSMTIFNLFKWLLVVTFIISSIAMIMLVLLQRGEEGVFSKSRSDKITTDNNTLIESTITCAAILFGSAMILNGMFYYLKHRDPLHQSPYKVTISIEKPDPLVVQAPNVLE